MNLPCSGLQRNAFWNGCAEAFWCLLVSSGARVVERKADIYTNLALLVGTGGNDKGMAR